MKIKRQDDAETNKTTAFWLYEFAYDLEKKAAGVDYLKEYLDRNYRNKKFSTVEQKLNDIRDRVGFNLARKISDEIEKTSNLNKENSAEDCGCEESCDCGSKCDCGSECSCKKAKASNAQVKTAAKKDKKYKKFKSTKTQENILAMQNILNYIRTMIQHESHLSPMAVIDRCKLVDGLNYSTMQKIIDHDMLMSFIEDLISQSSKNNPEVVVTYVPLNNDDLKSSDNVADYYNHAEPSRY